MLASIFVRKIDYPYTEPLPLYCKPLPLYCKPLLITLNKKEGGGGGAGGGGEGRGRGGGGAGGGGGRRREEVGEEEQADLLVLAGSGFWTALAPEGLLTSLVCCLGLEPA